MIAPTKIYNNVPTLSPEEAADLVVEAIVYKPVRIATRLGIFGEVLHALLPRVAQIVMNTTFRMFPDSDAAKGRKDGEAPAGHRRSDRDVESHARDPSLTGTSGSSASTAASTAAENGIAVWLTPRSATSFAPGSAAVSCGVTRLSSWLRIVTKPSGVFASCAGVVVFSVASQGLDRAISRASVPRPRVARRVP